VKSNFAKEDIFYSFKQDISGMIKSKYKAVFATDDSMNIADNRESLNRNHVKLSQAYNFYADRNHTFFEVIQNLSDLDIRYVNKANSLTLVTARGEGLLFAKEKNFALSKDTFGFESIINNPHILNDYDIALSALKKLHSYVCEVHWGMLEDKDKGWINPFWQSWKQNKRMWQDEEFKQQVERKTEFSLYDVQKIANELLESR